ncbi:MAG: thioredoxin domain-containing protein [Alphaproteobacteria bacterium]|nr:MAG: thioredoxin domain-containing protein [Alphaproteobacteria bacterium]
MTDLPTENRLRGETSPYLLQHADNPVHWLAWGPDAFAIAQAHNRPILLSVGYAACHWCHVMAHESFENQEVADILNDHFVSIKVDREERPDVDQIYQHALALLGQQGGWPLTMFLTPKGEPFWGGTYFPRESAYGRPGFVDVLRRIAELYAHEPQTIEKNRAALCEALADLGRAAAPGTIAPDHLDDAAHLLIRHVDQNSGGFGGAPKFPQPFLFTFLWRAWLRTANQPFRKGVIATLDHMAEGGIYDHLGGGFARYAVDARWLVPHFEKMLYDNAQLLGLYTLAWQSERKPLYKQRIEETITWLAREMRVENAGFAAALDADSEGEEGKYYVWRAAEIGEILGVEDARTFAEAYDVTPSGNWEGRTILNRLHRVGHFDEAEERALAPMRARLRAEREKRPRPGRDDKVLADWNGLAIEALSFAGLVFDRPDWIDLATSAFTFITTNLSADDGNRLYHSYCAGRAQHRALLDDYANMIAAALALHEATQDPRYVDQARQWAEIVEDDFGDSPHGGYFNASKQADDLIVRPKTVHDTAVPAGNATMISNLARLFYLTGHAVYRQRAEAAVAAFGGEPGRSVVPLASYFNACDALWNMVQIVIRGYGPAAQRLRRAVYDQPVPARVVQIIDPDTRLPDGHPAAGKGLMDGAPTAYVCKGVTCSAPITDPDDLRDHLRSLSSALE